MVYPMYARTLVFTEEIPPLYQLLEEEGLMILYLDVLAIPMAVVGLARKGGKLTASAGALALFAHAYLPLRLKLLIAEQQSALCRHHISAPILGCSGSSHHSRSSTILLNPPPSAEQAHLTYQAPSAG